MTDKTATSKIRSFFALETNIVVLSISIFILGLGENLWSKFVPKYLQFMGATALLIGVFGTLQEVIETAYQYPGGCIADYIGRKSSLVLCSLIALIGYIIFLFAPSWQFLFLGLFFIMAISLSQPAIFALIGDSLPRRKRAMGFSVQSILKRVPLVLGPPVGGWLIAGRGIGQGMRIALAITVALTILATIIQNRYYLETYRGKEEGLRRRSFLQGLKELHPSLRSLLISDCVIRFADRLTKIFVIFHVTETVGASMLQYGLLVALQMSVSIASYLPAARLSDRGRRTPFVGVTFLALTLFPLILFFSRTFLWLLVAFIVLGFRETGEPPRKAMIVDLAPKEKRGESVGIYYTLRGLAVMPAPILGGILWGVNPQALFLLATVIGVVAILLLLTTVRETHK